MNRRTETTVVNAISAVSQLVKKTLEEHRAGLLALEHVSDAFDQLDRALQSGNPKKIKTASLNIMNVPADIEKIIATAQNEGEYLKDLAKELRQLPGVPDQIKDLMVGYA